MPNEWLRKSETKVWQSLTSSHTVFAPKWWSSKFSLVMVRLHCNHTLKMTNFFTTLNPNSLGHLTFHIVSNKTLGEQAKYQHNELGLGTCQSQPHCLETISPLFWSHLRFSTLWFWSSLKYRLVILQSTWSFIISQSYEFA